MRVTIRLYKRYDIDLLSLYHNSAFPFQQHFKDAIRNYIRGTPKKIMIPEPQDDKFSYETIQFQMALDAKIDKDIIAWIRNIKNGYKNSILKNIFRNSLSGVYYYYIMNIHRADEMQRLNKKTISITEVTEPQRKEITKSIEKNETPKISEDINKKDVIDFEDKDTEDFKPTNEENEIFDTNSSSPEIVPKENTDAYYPEPEKSNDLTDINDSYENDDNDTFDNDIFAIAGKMMQGL